jgi:mannosyltransferase OCH1-like enzyme
MIPKVIHQIWLQGKNLIPNNFDKNINSIKHKNSDFKYIIWDEIQILELISENKEWVNLYYKFIYIHQKIDFAKYVILHKFGGIYIDIDVEIIKSFNDLIEKYKDFDTIVSVLNIYGFESIVTSGNSTSYNNGIILTKKDSIVMKSLIDEIIKSYYVSSIFHFKVLLINNTTGPNIFTRVINKNLQYVKVLDSEYLEPCVRDDCLITDNTIAIHKHNLSWMPDELKNLIDLYLKHKMLFLICVIILMYVIIKKNLGK